MGPFATATELGDYVGITPPSDLSRWQSHLEAASALIRGFTGQTLSLVTNEQVVLPPIDRPSIIVPQRPITAISQVLVNGSAVTDYWFAGAVIYRGTVTGTVGADWTYGATVTYSHGYAETSAEFALFRTICMDMAARALQGPAEGPEFGGISPETVGWSTQVFLTDAEQMQLASFGAVPVG